MRPLLLIFAALVIPAMAWGPIGSFRRLSPSPTEFVINTARLNNVPPSLALSIWEIEASLRSNPPRGIKNGKPIARGAFQVTRAAAKDAGCESMWPYMDKFGVSVTCGMRYLAMKLKACGRPTLAAHAFYTGHCPRGGKIWGYAQDVGVLMMKHNSTEKKTLTEKVNKS